MKQGERRALVEYARNLFRAGASQRKPKTEGTQAMTHTPRPWKSVTGEQARMSGSTESTLWVETEDDIIAKVYDLKNLPILTAAPKMLETLEEVSFFLDRLPPRLRSPIRAVISEAKGEKEAEA